MYPKYDTEHSLCRCLVLLLEGSYLCLAVRQQALDYYYIFFMCCALALSIFAGMYASISKESTYTVSKVRDFYILWIEKHSAALEQICTYINITS